VAAELTFEKSQRKYFCLIETALKSQCTNGQKTISLITNIALRRRKMMMMVVVNSQDDLVLIRYFI